MTSARSRKEMDPRDLIICEAVAAEIEKQRRATRRNRQPLMTEGRVAVEAFGQPQQWLSRRVTGLIAFTPAELMTVGDYLGVNIIEWYDKAKGGNPSPGESLQPTGEYPTLYVASHNDEPVQTVRPRGHLTLAARVA